MRYWYLALVFCVLPFVYAANSTNIDGVTISGIDYDCGVDDSVCPATYDTASRTCWTCDPNCFTPGLENTIATCEPSLDCADNDGDGLVNWDDNDLDGTPNYATGASCNVCDIISCKALNPASVKFATAISSPSLTGTTYSNATALRPGSSSALRMDFDGISGSGSCWCGSCDPGYFFNTTTLLCQYNFTDCFNTAPPVIDDLLVSYSPTDQEPSYPSLTLQGTISPFVVNARYQIDTNSNPSVYESTTVFGPEDNSVTYDFPSSLTDGTYTYYARIIDSCNKVDTGEFTVVVTPDTSPTINAWTVYQRSIWGGENVSFNYTFTDNNAGAVAVLTFGNGVPASDTQTNPLGSALALALPPHFYSAGGPYTATLTVTDSAGQSVSDTKTITAVSLPCITGNQTGNQTYDNDPAQCCNDGVTPVGPLGNDISCTAQIAGVWNCFAPTSCYADGNTTCGRVPPVWINRDTDSTACEMATTLTCQQYTWSDVTPTTYCCGDDVDEHLADWTYYGQPPLPLVPWPPEAPDISHNACCSSEDMCYTNVGTPSGCQPGAENTNDLCDDGRDNDCDGLVDARDPSCAAGGPSNAIYGTVTLNTPLGIQNGVGASIILTGGFNAIANEIGEYSMPSAGWLPLGAKTIYASLPGYTTVQKSFNIGVGESKEINFELQERRCNADCTNDQGYCDASCIGIGDCQPSSTAAVTTLLACSPQGAPFGLKKDTEVILAVNETTNELLVGVCCTVPAAWRAASAVTVNSASPDLTTIDTLVKFTRLVTMNGKTYKLVINTW